ncbi:DUF1565 domain-containing protein [Spirochaetia bacterium 38H-sp]|uniref:DUF1565 domain-containing protein n=1 Tax=Rarispira pelagica TaxID=3141764 RepID=A0ABU9UDK1_9SPIR
MKKISVLLCIIFIILTLSCTLTYEDTAEVSIDIGDIMPSRGSALPQIETGAPIEIGGVRLTVRGPNMPKIEKKFLSGTIAITIPAGADREFYLEIYDTEQSLAFIGTARADLYPGATARIRIKLQTAPGWVPTVYVSSLSNAQMPDGSKQYPFSTISDAIAYTQGPVEIRVAAGTYNESLQLRDGIRLKGGYNYDFSLRKFYSPADREDINYKTTISSAASTYGTGIIYITGGCLIEGFTIENTSGATSGDVNVIISDIFSYTNKPIYILNNTINNNNASANATAIGITGAVNTHIVNNLITMDKYNTYSKGIVFSINELTQYASTYVIANNAIQSNKAIELADNSLGKYYVLGNSIDAATAIAAESGDIYIANNIIIASGASMTGASLDITGKTQNNYIYYTGAAAADPADYTGTSNIHNGSSLPSVNPTFNAILKAKENIDIRIFTGGANLSSVIDSMSVPDSIRALLYLDAENISRLPTWAIGAYQSSYM